MEIDLFIPLKDGKQTVSGIRLIFSSNKSRLFRNKIIAHFLKKMLDKCFQTTLMILAFDSEILI